MARLDFGTDVTIKYTDGAGNELKVVCKNVRLVFPRSHPGYHAGPPFYHHARRRYWRLNSRL